MDRKRKQVCDECGEEVSSKNLKRHQLTVHAGRISKAILILCIFDFDFN